jgi:hypothetical protein
VSRMLTLACRLAALALPGVQAGRVACRHGPRRPGAMLFGIPFPACIASVPTKVRRGPGSDTALTQNPPGSSPDTVWTQ